MADSDGGESDASGSTVDLHSPAPQQTPEKRLSDHIKLTDAAFSPSSSGALHDLLSHREQNEIDIDSPDQGGYTTLMTCIKHRRRDSALLLMRNGADVLAVNGQCWSAFHFAASTGDLKVLQGLVAAARRASPTALAEALVAPCRLKRSRLLSMPSLWWGGAGLGRAGRVGAPQWRWHVAASAAAPQAACQRARSAHDHRRRARARAGPPRSSLPRRLAGPTSTRLGLGFG